MKDKTNLDREMRQMNSQNPSSAFWASWLRKVKQLSLVFLLLLSLAALLLSSGLTASPPKLLSARYAREYTHPLIKYAAVATPALLQVFQVYPPVLTPTGHGLKLTNGSTTTQGLAVNADQKGCVVTQTLMKHSFANSYEKPFVGAYQPPSCAFNRVTFNLTVLSAGRQFDRIAIVYFGNTEIWRWSTAEPTADGIEFGYIKDMSNYLALFQEPQKLIFDLGNLINNIYTAPFNATLRATFFSSDDTVDPADKIYTISTNMASENMASVFQYPKMKASDAVTIPRNTRKAVFTVAATGQIDEEFWFGNVLTSEVDTFGTGVLFPYSPFREVQLRIDGRLAGVVWPFPIIFTGGVVPGLWRPIVGIDAFDLKEDEIDITPWLGMLCDGKPHTFELNVTGIDDNGHNKGHLTPNIGSYWLLTGKIFTWLDSSSSVTSGSSITHSAPSPSIQLSSKITKTKSGSKNKTLTYTVGVSRSFSISSTIRTASGTMNAVWSQDLNFTNHGIFSDNGNVQYTKMLTTGSDYSSNGYMRRIEYPITVNQTYATNKKTKAFTIDATLRRGQSIFISGRPVFPTGLQSFNAAKHAQGGDVLQSSLLQTTQNGSGHYFANGKNTISKSSGTTQQDMTFAGFRYQDSTNPDTASTIEARDGSSELYQRHVVATNGTVIEDEERLFGKPFNKYSVPKSQVGGAQEGFASNSVERFLGRGPQAL